MLTEAAAEARILSSPRAIWQVYPYEAEGATINAHSPLILHGESVKNHLSLAIYAVLLTVTIGSLLENEVAKYFSKGEYTKGFLIDAAGTTAVEAAADQAARIIIEDGTKLGCLATTRFSPGYGDFDVLIQSSILDLANAQEIEVSATASGMLIPRKSITALIGLVPYEAGITPIEACLKDTCLSCKQINCLARKENLI